MASESGKKNWRTGEGLTAKDRFVRAGAIPLIAIAALTACSNTEAKPQPAPTSISTETPAPTDSPSTEPTGPDAEPTDTPTPGEFEGVPSGLEVDYEAFADWENITSSRIPGGSSLEEDRYDHTFETSKRSICYNFFESNGLEINVDMGSGYELDSNGERFDKNPEFLNSMLARQDMVIALARDDTDPRNLQVALNIVECLTSPDSESRQYFISQIEGIRDGSIQPEEQSLQTVNSYVAEDNGLVIANYTMVNSAGETSTVSQRWDARSSGSGLYRSTKYTIVE